MDSKQPLLNELRRKQLWKTRFDPFGFDNVFLNNTSDPDENMLNNLSQIDLLFYAAEEAATSFKIFSHKNFSVLPLNVRSLNQNFESLKLHSHVRIFLRKDLRKILT